jgi:DNA-binding CsgD family transcriptional regulator
VARLRELAALHPLKEVADLMGRSHSAIRNAVHRFDVDCDRAWTEGQLARLRAEYGCVPARQLAASLGRSLDAVYRMARLLELTRHGPPRFTEEDLVRIQELNGQGFSDTEIAELLGRDRHEVSRHRKRLNLPSRQYGERVRARLAVALRRQLERLGMDSPNDLRRHAHQCFARRFGLPDDLPPKAVLIVLALLQRGVMTRREVHEAVGAPWRNGRGSMLCNASGTSYLGELQRRGLVTRVHRHSTGPDARRLPNLYLLTPAALDLLDGVAQSATEEETHECQ